MTEQNRNDDAPNHASSMEQAEGSRDIAKSGNAQQGAGITNRSREREDEEQHRLPPRGQNKDGGHA